MQRNNQLRLLGNGSRGRHASLGPYLNLLPPSGEDIWAEIEQQVEALINQKINQLVYQTVQDDLTGPKLLSTTILRQLARETRQYLSTVDLPPIPSLIPSFRISSPLATSYFFSAQFANLSLSLLRDGVLFGSQWGWNSAYQQSIAQKLTKKVGDFTTYANQTYQNGYKNVVSSTAANNQQCQPFRSVNAFVRQMTLTVLDFVQNWPYFDATKYANPVRVYLSREIYSEPVGTCDNSRRINLPSSPIQPISPITVWGWDRIDAVQLTYPAGGGPGGVTQTARMGDQSGGSNQPPHGGFPSNNPVTVAAGLSGDILNAFTFTFQDGSQAGNWAATIQEDTHSASAMTAKFSRVFTSTEPASSMEALIAQYSALNFRLISNQVLRPSVCSISATRGNRHWEKWRQKQPPGRFR